MIIIPLNQTTLPAAIQLVQSIFIHDDPAFISWTLAANVNPKKYHDLLNSFATTTDRCAWVALEAEKVMGVVGYYTLLEDMQDAAWLSWFCVAPQFRGKKIGLTLLETAITAVTAKGKSYLRLYTSDIDDQRRAHQMYKQRGFTEFRQSQYDPKTKTNLLYLQLSL